MERYLIIIGLLLNSAYIIVNRYIRELPNWVAIPVLLICISLMITGAFLTKGA